VVLVIWLCKRVFMDFSLDDDVESPEMEAADEK